MSLLEVLITVVLLGVGLLGIAGMQVAGLKNNANANLRSQAAWLAYDIVDRMRANKDRAKAGEYDIAMEDDPPPGSDNLAEQDLAEWLGQVAGSLPQGDGEVSIEGEVVTITLRWNERENDQADQKVFTLETRL